MSEQDNSKNKRLKPQILSNWSKIKRSKVSKEEAKSKYLELGDQVLNYILSDEGQSGALITQEELRNKIKNFHFGAISSGDLESIIDIIENKKGPARLSKRLLEIENLQLDETIANSLKAAGGILSAIEELFIDRFGEGVFDPVLAPDELRDLHENTLPYGVKSAFKYKVINALSMQGDVYSIDETGNPRVLNFNIEDCDTGNKIADYAMYNPITKAIDVAFVSTAAKDSIQDFLNDEDSVYCAYGLEQAFFAKNTAAIDMAVIQKMMGDRKVVLDRHTNVKMTAKDMGTLKIKNLRNEFYSELGFIEKDDQFEVSFIKIREFLNTEEFSELFEDIQASKKYQFGVAQYATSVKYEITKSLSEFKKIINSIDSEIVIPSDLSLINLPYLGAVITSEKSVDTEDVGLTKDIINKFLNLNFVIYSGQKEQSDVQKEIIEKGFVSNNILKEFGNKTDNDFEKEIHESLKVIRSSTQEAFRHVFVLLIASLKAQGADINLYEESDQKDVWSFYTSEEIMKILRSSSSSSVSSSSVNAEVERKRKAAIDYLVSKQSSIKEKIKDKEIRLQKIEADNASLDSNIEYLQLSITSINEELLAVKESKEQNSTKIENVEGVIERLNEEIMSIEKDIARVNIISDETEILKILD